MILNRIQPIVYKLLRNNQNGFRPGIGTIAHILIAIINIQLHYICGF